MAGPEQVIEEMLSLGEDFQPVLKETSDYELTKAEEQRLLSFLNKQHDNAWVCEPQQEARRRWAKLVDYDAGRQAYDRNASQYVGHETAGAPSADNNLDDKYHIFNIIRRLSGSNVQRLSSYTIQPTVTPNNTDPDNKEGARLGRIALADLFNKMGEKKMSRRIATIVNKYGTVFQKVW